MERTKQRVDAERDEQGERRGESGDALGRTLSGFRTRVTETEDAEDSEPAPLARFGGVSTQSLGFAAVLRELERVAPTDLGVLFLGESGTGKEHLARLVHAASPRRHGPFVAINCAALSEQLTASELFGHVRGAFTGADTERRGAFQSASGGTLLLDEIGDAPLAVQVALLRVLEQGTVRPVGADREVRVDVRVVAATSRTLEELLGDGSTGALRRDLYFRLADVVIAVPPLRERREDVAGLVRELVGPAQVSAEALALLRSADWLGNVRQLRSALRRAIALSGSGERGAVLGVEHFDRLAGVRPAPREALSGLGGSHGRAMPGLGGAELREPFVFPQRVRELAARLEQENGAVRVEGVSRQMERAHLRAALLCLAQLRPRSEWSPELGALWLRLFRAGWETAEGGRGWREMGRVLGVDWREILHP